MWRWNGRYIYTGGNAFRVRFYRQQQEGAQVRICDYLFSPSSFSNICYTGNFTSVNQDSYKNGHSIKLLNAGEEDEGEYWCSIQIIQIPGGPPSTSSKLQLDVQRK